MLDRNSLRDDSADNTPETPSAPTSTFHQREEFHTEIPWSESDRDFRFGR